MKAHLQLSWCAICFCFMTLTSVSSTDDATDRESSSMPNVMVAVLVRNKEHTLPWFLYYLENLDYPKQHMRLWIRSDHNEDRSAFIIKEWLSHVEKDYNSVNFTDDDSQTEFSDAKSPLDWSPLHFSHVIHLRQEALDTARESWADFLLFIDADNILVNHQVLRELISQDRLIIGPMLNTTVSEHYSNFWAGMDSYGYYTRTADYKPIQLRHIEGVFAVPMVHSTILIKIQDPNSQVLSYNPPPPGYAGPTDDIIVMAHSVKHHGWTMHIDNRNFYGFFLYPMEEFNTLQDERDQFIHVLLENIAYATPLKKLQYLGRSATTLSKLGFSEIYMINLERRPDRRQKMVDSFAELGISVKIMDAVDGKLLNESYLNARGVKLLPGFSDPFKGRLMTMGEIGCFLSHYNIWEDILINGHERILVFEDDVRFKPYFNSKLSQLMDQVAGAGLSWDLIYLGRKILRSMDEAQVEDISMLVWPHYSYWTISYMLSYRGAWKLVQQNPLTKLVPVDEYLPIMFNAHPVDSWKSHFYPRDLVALSVNPLLLEPTHYTGEPGYFTDTEDSPTVDDETVRKLKGDPDLLPSNANSGNAVYNVEL